jgi:hypothetical protein
VPYGPFFATAAPKQKAAELASGGLLMWAESGVKAQPATAAATSAAKSLVSFSMPSPSWKRT